MKRAVFAIVLLGCGKDDDCQRVMDKSWAVLGDIARAAGKPLDRGQLVERCRAALKEGKRDPVMDCVLAAGGEGAVRDCYGTAFGEYMGAAKASEATVMLNKLGKAAKVAYFETSLFPSGTVGPTPPTPCCEQPGATCAANLADWQDPVWQSLDFEIYEPSRFQYSYTSNGTAFTATAVGDLDCSGRAVTYTATGTAEQGNPMVQMIEPR